MIRSFHKEFQPDSVALSDSLETQYFGHSVKVLRRDTDTGASTSLVRFEPGTRFPAHNHPAGEEIFVLEGDFTVGAHRMVSGDYLYTPPNEKHAASTEGGCLVLVTLPKPVEIL